jgi:hypothetical protein
MRMTKVILKQLDLQATTPTQMTENFRKLKMKDVMIVILQVTLFFNTK